MIDNKKRFAHIDSLRAIAALLVVWLHTSEIFVHIAKPSSQDVLYRIADFFDFGRIGVVIFFAISGFLIPSSLYGNGISAVRSFAIKRFFRMYPMYWVSIPLGLITSWYIWDKPIAATSILWNFTMVQEAAGHPSIQGLYWTLQTELVFYAACVVLFLLNGLKSVFVLGSMALLFTVAHLGPPVLAVVGVHVPSITIPSLATMSLNLGVMFWGAVFRQVVDESSYPTVAKTIVYGYVAAWVCLVSYAIKMIGINPAYWKLCGPYAVGVIVFTGAVLWGKMRPALLVWLGTVSYSIYLLHPVVMYSISRIVQVSDVEWIKGWTTGSYMAITVLLTVLVSAVTYRYIERPSIRIGAALANANVKKPIAVVDVN